MGRLVTGTVRITQATSGVTLAAGTADKASVIAEFVVSDRTGYRIRPGDIMSLVLKDTTPTEIATTAEVKVIHTDPQGIMKHVVAEGPYTAYVEWQDRTKLFQFSDEIVLAPDDRLQIEAKANLAIATAQTKFQISALRAVELISF